MLDNYIDSQNIPYKILKNAVEKNKVSHAYLFVSNGYPKAYDFALSFAKFLLCPYNYFNNSKCNGCFQCQNIDNNNFTEIKIIQPEGLWIKKEQLNELQEEFNKTALVGNKKVYIINHAECLNSVSSNSILKFLEEPVPNVYAILLAENQFQILETILSRCQIINLNKITQAEKSKYENNTYSKVAFFLANNNNDIELYTKEEYKIKIEKAIEFINNYENKGINALLDMNKTFNEIFKEKNDIIYAFTIFILYYKDVLNKLLDNKIEIFEEFEEKISLIAAKNNKNKIINKINIIMKAKENILYNANINLLMDKLIIDLQEV